MTLNIELVLGYEIVKHLDTWLIANVRDEDLFTFNEIRNAMMRVVAANPDYLDRGWWSVYDAARQC